MGIKNMPIYDPIDDGSENKKHNSAGMPADLEALISQLGLPDSLKQTLLSSFDSMEELNLDDYMNDSEDGGIESALGELSDDELIALGQSLSPMLNGIMPGLQTMLNDVLQHLEKLKQGQVGNSKQIADQIDSGEIEKYEPIDEYLNSSDIADNFQEYVSGHIRKDEFIDNVYEILSEDIQNDFDIDLDDEIDIDLPDAITKAVEAHGSDYSDYQDFVKELSQDLHTIFDQYYDEINNSDEEESEDEDTSESEADNTVKPEPSQTSTQNTQSKNKLLVHPDDVLDLFNRTDKKFDIEYHTFTNKQFYDHFGITDYVSDIDDPIASTDCLKEFNVPAFENFKQFTFAQQFLDDENKFVVCTLLMNYDDADPQVPFSFLIYQNKDYEWECYLLKNHNIVTDNGESLSLMHHFYTDDFVEKFKESLETSDDGMSMMSFVSNILGSNNPLANNTQNNNVSEDTKLLRNLYKQFLAESYFNEKNMYEYSKQLFINTVEHPMMSLSMLGTLEPSVVNKQYGEGYIYIGDVTLNNSDDVKYFLMDFELVPNNNKLEFYIKCGDKALNNNDLHHVKESINSIIDFNDEKIKNKVELSTVGNIVYIDLGL